MAKSKPRAPIDPKVMTAILTKSRRRCCLCFFLDSDETEKKGQVAHLDDDRSNPSEDNLVWLCIPHHSEYDSTTRQHKNYTIDEVKSYRDRLYEVYDPPVQWAFTVSGKGEEPTPEEIQRIITQLKTLGPKGDIKFVRQETGSVRLVLQGSKADFEAIQGLFKSQSLKVVEEQQVVDVAQYYTNILSIDAGRGARSLFPALFVRELSERITFLNQFDLFVGAGESAILCVGLAMGMSPSELCDLLSEMIVNVYRRPSAFRTLRGLLGYPLYSKELLRKHLQAAFAGHKMSDCRQQVLVPAFGLHDSHLRVFDSASPENGDLAITDVLLASLSDPLLFGMHEIHGCRYISAIGCVSTPVFGVSAAKQKGAALDRIRVVSVGTGESQSTSTYKGGIAAIPLLMNSLITTSERVADLTCQSLLDPGNYIRISPPIPQPIQFDNIEYARDVLASLANLESYKWPAKIEEWVL